MKRLSFLVVIIIIMTLSCKQENNNTGNEERYGIESAAIKYKTEMMGISSESVFYFKDYGKIECTESTAKNMGQESHSRRFIKEGYAYTLDMRKKTGVKMKHEPLPDSILAPEEMDFNNIPEKIKTRYNIEEIGTETVAGKDCIIYSMNAEAEGAKQKISVWENIPLKVIHKDHGIIITTTATEVLEKPTLPKGIFDIPEGFEIINYSSETPTQDTETDNISEDKPV